MPRWRRRTVTPGLIAGAALGLLLYHRADASAFALWSGSVRRWHAAQASASVHAMTMEVLLKMDEESWRYDMHWHTFLVLFFFLAQAKHGNTRRVSQG